MDETGIIETGSSVEIRETIEGTAHMQTNYGSNSTHMHDNDEPESRDDDIENCYTMHYARHTLRMIDYSHNYQLAMAS